MKFCSVALIASTARAFAPSKLFTGTNKHQGIIIRTHQSSGLRLLPDPELANIVADSAFSSSSITTSNLIDGIMSDMGGFLLIASVGAGVYSNTLKAKQKEFQDKLEEKYMKKTDHTVMAVPTKTIAVAEPEVADSVDDTVEQEEPVVIEEEADEEVIEAIEEVTEEIIPTPAPVPPTSELVLKETEKAIAEVKAKGVQETKAKMSFNEPVLSPSSPTPEQVEEPKNDVITKKEKDPGTKKQIAQGITLIVAAAGVALARNVIKAWLGRGMF